MSITFCAPGCDESLFYLRLELMSYLPAEIPVILLHCFSGGAVIGNEIISYVSPIVV